MVLLRYLVDKVISDSPPLPVLLDDPALVELACGRQCAVRVARVPSVPDGRLVRPKDRCRSERKTGRADNLFVTDA